MNARSSAEADMVVPVWAKIARFYMGEITLSVVADKAAR